jgi:hypothetical protein
MMGAATRWLGRGGLALAVVVGMSLAALGQQDSSGKNGNPNEREVKPKQNVQDPDEIFEKDGKTYKDNSKIWVLEFKFKDPRLITVDIPGRGRKLCYYLWYQVINKTREPRSFIPDFELVTLDKQTIHHDQVLPKVQEAIAKLEDPTGYLNIKNSVTIAAEPIPATKPDAAPKPVTGVAIWDDVNPETTRFAIFVSGLSNGWSLTDGAQPGDPPIVRRKTLQLNFKRGGDAFYKRSEDIQFMGPAQWMYRGSKLDVPALPKLDGGESADKKKEPAEKPKENDKPKDNGKEKEKPKDKD